MAEVWLWLCIIGSWAGDPVAEKKEQLQKYKHMKPNRLPGWSWWPKQKYFECQRWVKSEINWHGGNLYVLCTMESKKWGETLMMGGNSQTLEEHWTDSLLSLCYWTVQCIHMLHYLSLNVLLDSILNFLLNVLLHSTLHLLLNMLLHSTLHLLLKVLIHSTLHLCFALYCTLSLYSLVLCLS